ncbi:hypothetical protein ADM96_37535 [Burkholderia sp. ST111]|nr:hypothetical protein ADM96_37535 [Burkholderia sp. ST111]
MIAGLESSTSDLMAVVDRFLSDLARFSTENQLSITNISSWGQNIVFSKALYNLARSDLLAATYKTIDLLSTAAYYKDAAIPHKLRLAIELKLRSMIGFAKAEIIDRDNHRREVGFPTSLILEAFAKSEVAEFPCDPLEIKKIYEWACKFSHTGKSDFIWIHLSALGYLSLLFDNQNSTSIISAGVTVYNYLKSGKDLPDLEAELNRFLKKKNIGIMLLPELMEDHVNFYDSSRQRYL